MEGRPFLNLMISTSLCIFTYRKFCLLLSTSFLCLSLWIESEKRSPELSLRAHPSPIAVSLNLSWSRRCTVFWFEGYQMTTSLLGQSRTKNSRCLKMMSAVQCIVWYCNTKPQEAQCLTWTDPTSDEQTFHHSLYKKC